MTVLQAITQARRVRENQYDDEQMVQWLSDLDAMLYQNVIKWHEQPEEEQPEGEPPTDENTEQTEETPEVSGERKPGGPYDPEKDMDAALLVPDPYSRLYVLYIMAQVDFLNAELSRYNNTMVMYNMALSEYANWYNRNNMPRQDNYISI